MTPMLTIGYLTAIYVIGAFLTAVAIGFFRPYTDDDLDWLVICLWPLALIVIGAASIGDAIEDWADRNPRTAHRIGSILDRMTIPFRPITLGRKIREWCDNRKMETKKGKNV